jgi:2-polyprenyl-6-methoxyphenol hydroxylase-like FAD-dependent oxidoreductase
LAASPKVLIVGGGVGGMSCAISMRQAGMHVDLAEIDPHWKIYGAGITITGPTLRALKTLGVLDEVKAQGATWNGAYLFTRSGQRIQELDIPPISDDLPATGGIMRPVLHKILSDRTLALGANVRLGTTVQSVSQLPDGVDVTLSDGHRARYDLMVSSDGISSTMRERIFPEAPKPKFTGQMIYRIVAERPLGFDRTHFYMGDDTKLGFNPVSRTHMYMFLLEHRPDNQWVDIEEQPRRLYDLMAGWGGIVPQVRETVLTTNAHTINYRPLEALLMPKPWYRGRVVLIGDAAHATTPHLASGAGMAIEDGIVLAEELARSDSVDAGLAQFMDRRFARGKLVVENSLRLGEIEMNHGSPQEHTRIMVDSMTQLRQPA